MRTYAQAAAVLAALLVMAPLTSGCGSGVKKAGSGTPSRARGAMTVTIKWPQQPAGRVIPLAAGSIVIALQRTVPGPTIGANPTVPPLTAPAPDANPRVTTRTIDNLELGTYHITATAYPNADGTGTAQAVAAVDQEVAAGQNDPLPLTMGATVKTVEMSPASGSALGIGQTRQFTATAKNDGGDVVIVALQAFQWKSKNPAVVSVDANGVAKALGAGTVDITATYVEPNVAPGEQGTGAVGTSTVDAVQTSLAPTSWPKFHGNAQNTGLAVTGGPTSNRKQWDFQADGSVFFSSPTVGTDGTVYVGAYDGKLYALKDGSARWAFPTGDVIDSSPAVGAQGAVFVGSYDGNVYAVNADTGALLWKTPLKGPVVASPTLGLDGILYVGASAPDTSIYALDPITGAILWQLATGDGVQTCASFSLDGKTLYVGSLDKKLYALDITDPANVNKSRVRWTYLAGDQIYSSSPAVAPDGTIYFGAFDGKLYAVTPSGAPKWGIPFDTGNGAQIFSTPAIGGDGTIYVGTYDNAAVINKVVAVNPNGTKKWDASFSDGITSSPAIGIDGVIYVGCYDGNLYALNPADGAQKWAFAVGDIVDSSPAIGADGTIYIGGNNGKVFAIK